MTDSDPSILLYDDKCGLCITLAEFVLKRDTEHKLKFIELQSTEGQLILKNVGLPTSDFDSLVYIKNNCIHLKSSASLLLLKDLGGIWKVFYIFMIVPEPIRDFIYNTIAKNRYSFFGKQKSCKLSLQNNHRHGEQQE